jgi:oligopeptide/dipeptide ABC transporter ATP-binding protein
MKRLSLCVLMANTNFPHPLGKPEPDPLLQIIDLTVDFDMPAGWLRCLHGVDLEVYPGEILGLVGESGCGKSITCMAVMQLLGPRARFRGKACYKGYDLLALDEQRLTQMRGCDIAMIFQDPVSSLNPIHTIGRQVIESVVYNSVRPGLNDTQTITDQVNAAVEQFGGLTGQAARDEAERLLTQVDIPEAKQRLKEYPHQLSGGMNQRAMIAMALAGRPQLLIADEPTTALDVTIQAQILELIRGLRNEMGMSILLITHDLAVVAETCDRVAVMYCGRIVEKGPVESMFSDPHHPYTRGLLASLPRIDRRAGTLFSIPGSVPAPHEMPSGCAFEPRCAVSLNECRTNRPVLVNHRDGRSIACANPQHGVLRP